MYKVSMNKQIIIERENRLTAWMQTSCPHCWHTHCLLSCALQFIVWSCNNVHRLWCCTWSLTTQRPKLHHLRLCKQYTVCCSPIHPVGSECLSLQCCYHLPQRHILSHSITVFRCANDVGAVAGHPILPAIVCSSNALPHIWAVAICNWRLDNQHPWLHPCQVSHAWDANVQWPDLLLLLSLCGGPGRRVLALGFCEGAEYAIAWPAVVGDC